MELKEYEIVNTQDQELNLEALERECNHPGCDTLFEQLEGEEILEQRSENIKQYDLGENRYQAVVFPEAVHYRSAGEWREIDNNLDECESDGRKVLRNRANSLLCELPVMVDDGALVKLRSRRHVLTWAFERGAQRVQAQVKTGEMLRRERFVALAKESPANARREGESFTDDELRAVESPEARRCDVTGRTSQVLYSGILPGIDVRYSLSGEELKEDIICANRDALADARLKLPTEYNYVVNADRSLSVLDAESGAERFYFDMPVVYDAAGMTIIANPVIEDCGEYTRLTYELDPDFLAVCAWPVTIDPVVKKRGTSGGVEAMYVNLKATTPAPSDGKSRTSTGLYVGKNGEKRYASILEFKTLALLKASDTVISAKLKMSVAAPSKSKGKFVGAYEIGGTWDWATGTGEQLDALIKPEPLDYAAGGKSSMTFDITNLYRNWYRADNGGGSANYGIALKCVPNSVGYFALKSPRTSVKSKKPLLTVNFISHAGLESWWQTESQSAGRAGTMHVDLFNGNVVHEHQDTAMTGSRMPVSVSHYYNSCQSAEGSYHRQVPDDDDTFDPGSYQAIYRCGHGWRHSGLQFIYLKKINSKPYFVWVDGDGTEHWFKNESKYYEAECADMEGMGLKLHRYPSTNKRPPRIEIEDQRNNVMVFQNRPTKKWKGKWKHWWLWRVKDSILDDEDKAVNVTKYTYKLPAKDKDGMGSSKTMRSMEGWLEKITDPAGRTTSFEYAAGTELLSAIKTPDYDQATNSHFWREVNFGYDPNNGQLKSVSYSDLTASGVAAPHTRFSYIDGCNLLQSAENYDGLKVRTAYESVCLTQDVFDVDEDMDERDDDTGETTTDDLDLERVTMSVTNAELRRALSLETTRGTELGARQEFEYRSAQTRVTVVDGPTRSTNDKQIIYQFNDKGNVISTRDELGFAQFVKYSEEQGENGDNANQPTESSKMQKAVVNLLRNPDFSLTNRAEHVSAPVWTLFETNPYAKKKKNDPGNPTGNLASIDSSAENQCLNLGSLRLERRTYDANATGNPDELYASQTLSLEMGKVYTVSAYAKVDDIKPRGDMGGYIRITGAGAPTATGPQLIDDTEDDLEANLPTDGWDRYAFVYDTTGYSGTKEVTIALRNDAQSGAVWFAAPQIEEGYVANSCNLLSNSHFALTTPDTKVPGLTRHMPVDWTAGSNIDADYKKAKKKFDDKGTTIPNYAQNMGRMLGVQERGFDPEEPMLPMLPGKYLQIVDKPRTKALNTYFHQSVNASGKKGDVFFVGGWASGMAMPGSASKKNEARAFRIAVKFYCKQKGKTTRKWMDAKGGKVPFNAEWVGWQAAGGAVAAPAEYSQIRVYLVATGQPNPARFSNLFLLREEFGRSYSYDKKNKDMISSTDFAGLQRGMEYDKEHNLTSYRKAGRPKKNEYKYKMTYGGTKKRKQHLLMTATTPEGMTTKNSYDDYGNKTSERTSKKGQSHHIRTRTEYNGEVNVNIGGESLTLGPANYAVKKVDARGNAATMNVDPVTGLLNSAKDPNGTVVGYTYDAQKRLTKVRAEPEPGKIYENSYTYDQSGRLQTVTHNTAAEAGAGAAPVTYTFEYDALGNQTKVYVGSAMLSENTYDGTRGHKLKTSAFGNGGAIHNEYDEFDRVQSVRFDNETTPRYEYKYGANGQVAYLIDHHLGRVHKTEYDLALRPKRSMTLDEVTNAILYRATLRYNRFNQLTHFGEETRGNETYMTNYEYDNDDRTTEVAFDDDCRTDDEIDNGVEYAYNNYGLVGSKTVHVGDEDGKHEYTVKHNYLTGGFGDDSRSPLVSKIEEKDLVLQYEYDTVGNITKETRTPKDGEPVSISYAYDKLGQLIRVDDPTDAQAYDEGTTWVYEYDLGGNILRKRAYPHTTGELSGAPVKAVNYEYNNPNWSDQLTAYDGEPITYDAIGNPLSYGGWTYEWIAGRKLARMRNAEQTLEFSYDASGLRTQKQVTQHGVTTTTNYTLHGKLLTHLTQGNHSMHFYYDKDSKPQALKFMDQYYAYQKNLQGDIIGIIDKMGAVVVRYRYDAWGRPTGTETQVSSATDAATLDVLAELNPFRYRGYIFDEETGLYYLRSRYYNPECGRFVNADSELGKIGRICVHNTFVYCLNTPIMRVDHTGRFAIAIGAGVGIVEILKFMGITALAAGAGTALGQAANTIFNKADSTSSTESGDTAKPVPAPGPAPTTAPTPSPKSKTITDSKPPIEYPGDDPNVAPEDFEWRGKGTPEDGSGNYYNPKTGESLHPDLNHAPPIGPHWDYWGPDRVKHRIFPK